MFDQHAEIRKILKRIMESVHNLDYEGVRDLIPDDGVYFGSAAVKAHGYDELYEKQFSRVWPVIDQFKIDPSSISIHTSDKIAWAICLFESTVPVTGVEPPARKGRMTFIFERRNEKWVMVHSHDSLYPTREDNSKKPHLDMGT